MAAMQNFSKLNWEVIEHQELASFFRGIRVASIRRAKVFGGWLVESQERVAVNYGTGVGLTFVPDPNHEWTL